MRKKATVVAAGFAVIASAVGVHAHKPITSKYTYADVLPIVERQCGSCHAPGQAAPMSLLRYQDALPWAESIRQEVVTESMPPWFDDPTGPRVKGSRTLTATELDTLVTWASGGTPEGERRPAPAPADRAWTLGPPDLVLAPESMYAMPADLQEDWQEFALSSPLDEDRWVRAADLRPGDPTLVRDAALRVEGGQTLLAWVPGEKPAAAPDIGRFRLPARARLVLRVHYRKSWRDERQPKSDRSQVGLYLEPAGASASDIRADGSGETFATAARVVAVRPSLDNAYGSVEVRAIPRSGEPIVLLRLHNPRPGWPRRYWLEKPIAVPAGARLSVITTPPAVAPEQMPVRPDGPLGAQADFVDR